MYSFFLSRIPLLSNDSSFFEQNNFLDDFVQLENISNDFLTPGRKRLLEKPKIEVIDWDINQDINYNDMPNKGDRVFHQKFGYGKVLHVDGEKVEIKFEKSDTKKVLMSFIKKLN